MSLQVQLCVLIFFFSITLNAGEVLHFKTGKVDIQKISESTTRVQSMWGQFKNWLGVSEAPPTTPYFVIQYHHIIEAADIHEIEAAGLDIINTLPDDALLVRVPPSKSLRFLEHSSHVRGTTEYLPEWKLSPELSLVSGLHRDIAITIKILKSDEMVSVAEYMSAHQIRYSHLSEKSYLAHASSSQIMALTMIPAVEWIELYYPPHTLDFRMSAGPSVLRGDYTDLNGYESGTKAMGFEYAWSKNLTGLGQIVAVADTGLDTGDTKTLLKDFVNFLAGFGHARASGAWFDSNGHGTHVSGSILGTGTMSSSRIRGGAYNAKLVMQGLMDDDGSFNLPSVKTLLDQAYERGARIHSNSWGSDNTSYDTRAVEFDEYVWNHPDFLIVFAAGNEGVDADENGKVDSGSVGSPGLAKNVLTIGASENLVAAGGIQKLYGEDRRARWPADPIASDKFSDNLSGIAAFSSRGPTEDGRRKPNLVAPGTNILSTRSQMPEASLLWGGYSQHYVFCGGTSMSTPLASGAAAVVRQYLVESRAQANPSAALVKATLMHTAYDLFPGQYGLGTAQEIPNPRPNNEEGYGRVDVAKAVNSGLRMVDEKFGVSTGERKNISLTLGVGATLNATLVYTDAPGLVSAAKALVNDLDLVLITPSGQEVIVGDRLNNDETLNYIVKENGSYTLQVRGVRVPIGKNGKQPYALVVSR